MHDKTTFPAQDWEVAPAEAVEINPAQLQAKMCHWKGRNV